MCIETQQPSKRVIEARIEGKNHKGRPRFKFITQAVEICSYSINVNIFANACSFLAKSVLIFYSQIYNLSNI